MGDNARVKKPTGKRDKAASLQVRDSSGSAKGKLPSQSNINLANVKAGKYEPYLEKAPSLVVNERADDQSQKSRLTHKIQIKNNLLKL